MCLLASLRHKWDNICTYAVADAGAERQESERMPTVVSGGEEAFRSERFRFGIQLRVVMHGVKQEGNRRSSR